MTTRGRRRQAARLRTPKGRISRAVAAQSEHIEPIATRMRMFGLTEPQARDQKAATFIGRLQFMGIKLGGISAGQYDAAVEYKRQRDAYSRALSAPDSLRNATATGGERSEDDHTAWCKAVIAKYKATERAITEAQWHPTNRGANLFAALDYLVMRDEAHGHMVGDLRIVLNALARHYGVRAWVVGTFENSST